MVASKGYEARKAARSADNMRMLRAAGNECGGRRKSPYWTVSDGQLKRDLRERTLRDVYRENKAGREASWSRYTPRDFQADCDRYMAWCEKRGHTPHPASIDTDHELNRYRERCPPRETVKDEPMNAKQMIKAVVNKAIAKGSPVIVEQRAADPETEWSGLAGCMVSKAARARQQALDVLRALELTRDLEPSHVDRMAAISAARAIVSMEATA